MNNKSINTQNLRQTLKSMEEHNMRVDMNNFFLIHMGMSYDEFKQLPDSRDRMLCQKHFEENCNKCRVSY